MTDNPAPQEFVQLLQQLPTLPHVFNPWRDVDEDNDIGPDSPRVRADNLRRYLEMRLQRARVIFVAEAPGYLGCHFSGIAMTSERILLGNKAGVRPEAVFAGPKQRTSKPALWADGANEPTASIAWGLCLDAFAAPDEFVFWNAFPCHPHQPDSRLSNRTPAPSEVASYRHVLPQMLALFPEARPVAVGRVAQRLLTELGVTAPAVRHPANGGARLFRDQVRTLLAG